MNDEAVASASLSFFFSLLLFAHVFSAPSCIEQRTNIEKRETNARAEGEGKGSSFSCVALVACVVCVCVWMYVVEETGRTRLIYRSFLRLLMILSCCCLDSSSSLLSPSPHLISSVLSLPENLSHRLSILFSCSLLIFLILSSLALSFLPDFSFLSHNNTTVHTSQYYRSNTLSLSIPCLSFSLSGGWCLLPTFCFFPSSSRVLLPLPPSSSLTVIIIISSFIFLFSRSFFSLLTLAPPADRLLFSLLPAMYSGRFVSRHRFTFEGENDTSI